MQARAAIEHRALLIDALGTLVRLAPPAPFLVAELGRRCGVVVSEDEAHRALLAEIAYYRQHMGDGRDDETLLALRRRCASVLRDALAPRAVADTDLTEVLLASLRFVAYPDAREALLVARRSGARVIVVSNWDVSLEEVMERIGLAPLLDGVVTSAAVGAAKPDPAIFAHALGLAGVGPERALHVGDSPDDDVAGAIASGIRAVLLRRGVDGDVGATHRIPDGVRVIGGLGELAGLG